MFCNHDLFCYFFWHCLFATLQSYETLTCDYFLRPWPFCYNFYLVFVTFLLKSLDFHLTLLPQRFPWCYQTPEANKYKSNKNEKQTTNRPPTNAAQNTISCHTSQQLQIELLEIEWSTDLLHRDTQTPSPLGVLLFNLIFRADMKSNSLDIICSISFRW